MYCFFPSFHFIYIGGRGCGDDNDDCILNRCASICAIESYSNLDTRKLVAYWVLYSLISLFEHAFHGTSWMVVLLQSILCFFLVALLPCSYYLFVYCISKTFKFCGNHRLIVHRSKISEKFTLVHLLPIKLFYNFDYLRDNSQINYAFQSMKMSWMV